MHRTKMAINNIVDLNELKENRTFMLKHFSDIEDEINQCIHSFKALLTKNADISEHAEICLKKARGHELKLISETKRNNQLDMINQEVNKENLNLKEILEEKNSEIIFLKEKLSYYENKLNEKEKENSCLREEINQNNLTLKRLQKEIDILKIELDAQNFSNEEDNKQEDELDLDNLKDVISEREYKKKLINDKIKDHFKSNKSNNVKSNTRYNLCFFYFYFFIFIFISLMQFNFI
jgi:hypothetical protein